MFHELLLALRGHSGGIFLIQNEQIKIIKELPFIHPSEEDLMNSLCQLGSFYKFFQDFIEKYSCCPTISCKQVADLRPGQYLKAFTDGLDVVLAQYRQVLLDLESQLVSDPHLTLVHIKCQLQEYYLLFPVLKAIIGQISTVKAHGCTILEILQRSSSVGIPSVQRAVQRILHTCHGVLYKQLAVWMLHGMLLDSLDEFFIHKLPPTRHSEKINDEDELGLGGLSGRQLQKLLKLDQDAPFASSHEQYSIRPEMLPSYIPLRVAEKILFVGESVQMFESDRKTTHYQKCGSILKESEDEFSRELHILSMDLKFDEQKFEDVINRIRTCVAEHLWTLVVKESDLFGQLRIIKEFYLLGRGELFLTFIDKAQDILVQPPTITTQHDVNVKLQQSARSVLLEDECLMRKFKLVIEARDLPKRPTTTKPSSDCDGNTMVTSESGWNLLTMTYSVDWPLHILFTSAVMEKYNLVFKFLLSVRRVQLELQQCWAHQMVLKQSLTTDREVIRWLLRTHMAFLVNNLQYYLQVDVIESLYTVLLDKIQATRDFEAIRLAHDHFITSLLSQSFQLMKPVSHCLHELLDTCHNFCTFVSYNGGVGEARELEKLENLAKTFQRQSNLLFRILSSVRSHQASPHLAQLLLRIDFNKYFSLAGGQLGNYAGLGDAAQRTAASQ